MITQKQAILKYHKTHKKASGLDFVKKLGILCYTKVISQIREDLLQENKFVIKTQLQSVKTRYGWANVAFYSLVRIKQVFYGSV